MTIGTATVARTKVRSTLGKWARVDPKARLMTVRVGKTATQIIRASSCLVGAFDGALVGALMAALVGLGVGEVRNSVMRGSPVAMGW